MFHLFLKNDPKRMGGITTVYSCMIYRYTYPNVQQPQTTSIAGW